MTMFPDQNYNFGSSSTSGRTSMDSSFSSASSWDSSFTPAASSRRDSFDSESFMGTPASSIADNYGCDTGFTATAEMMPAFQDSSMSGQNMMAFNGFNNFNNMCGQYQPFGSQQGLPTNPPSLCDHNLLSPTSEMISSPRDFVDPSQTFFSYDMPSPMPVVHMASSPSSEYTADISTFGIAHSPSETKFFTPDHSYIKSESTTPSRSAQRPICNGLSTSEALQHVQLGSNERYQQRKKVVKKEHMLLGKIQVQKQAGKRCDFPGCDKKFQRQEHLKRHEKTHGDFPKHPCEFCQKPFSRSDNLKSHIKLHILPGRKGGRTNYHPDAQARFDELSRKGRKSGDSRSFMKSESPCPKKLLRSYH